MNREQIDMLIKEWHNRAKLAAANDMTAVCDTLKQCSNDLETIAGLTDPVVRDPKNSQEAL